MRKEMLLAAAEEPLAAEVKEAASAELVAIEEEPKLRVGDEVKVGFEGSLRKRKHGD